MSATAFVSLCSVMLNKSRHSRKLARVFAKIVVQWSSKNEKFYIRSIEKQRISLNDSDETIQIMDGYNVPNEKYDQLKKVSTTVGAVSSQSSIRKQWALVLFRLIREFEPTTCFEMGTNIGISGAYQASALKLNEKGVLTSLELSSSKIDVARRLFSTLKLENVEFVCGKFQDTLEEQLDIHKPIDCIFIDGHHNGNATIEYFNQIAPRLSENALVVFDDINWSDDMKNAWKLLRRDPRLSVAVNFFRLGICVYNAS